MDRVRTTYYAAGTNRHPSAADWTSDTLIFGTDRNVALWKPLCNDSRGVFDLLPGHTDLVNVVKYFRAPDDELLILSGSVDKTVKLWHQQRHDTLAVDTGRYQCVQTIDHPASLNCIATNHDSGLIATGCADGCVRIFRIYKSLDREWLAELEQTITIKPRFFPLALALSILPLEQNSIILAIAGTNATIQLFVGEDSKTSIEFSLRATLSGHEGWIRSLEFSRESEAQGSDLFLASASQDKYIRLWRVHQGKELPLAAANSDPSIGAFMPGKSLSNKAHRFTTRGLDYSATFEALLLGHDDWIYSTSWKRCGAKLQLLSASADNSLAIWELDGSSGIWVSVARLGEISVQKGSTTATGSTGGFWTGLWSSSGNSVACIGRTGSWRIWTLDKVQDRWLQVVGISGHTKSVTGLSWSKNGDYLLSTSSDQTTRLHAQWQQGHTSSWHEISRPQIHGYDLNCIASLGASRFVSGADEKLLRVFEEPKAVANLLQTLCGIDVESDIETMPDAANMPVLGLSNKAIEAVEDEVEPESGNLGKDKNFIDPASIVNRSTLNFDHPPFEDHLSRHTLWPEIEKLYGHGYEISTLATSHDGTLIATACKASSIDHAVIRIFETERWHEIKPPLPAHSLTVTGLQFSKDDKYLLSVGRDRQWAVFERQNNDKNVYELAASNPKGHSRMILDATWMPGEHRAFATAGRDKCVKIWSIIADSAEKSQKNGFESNVTISLTSAVTAVDSLEAMIHGKAYLAVATENGEISIQHIDMESYSVLQTFNVKQRCCPSSAITEIAWRPRLSSLAENNNGNRIGTSQRKDCRELAVAAEDASLRIYSISLQ